MKSYFKEKIDAIFLVKKEEVKRAPKKKIYAQLLSVYK